MTNNRTVNLGKRASSRAVTVCVSLTAEYVQALDQVARNAGSRSAAIRQLLAENAASEGLKGMEAAYRDYFSDPAATKAAREMTRDLLSASSWLKPGTRAKRGKTKRGATRGP